MPRLNKPIKGLGRVNRTGRGFQLIKFKDTNGVPCSLQASSLAHYTQPGISAIWLGTDDAQPRVIHHEAAKVGVKTDATCGWVPFPIPPEVNLQTRAHLDRKQVKALITHLTRWLETGSF